ncbi:MAG: hypothetical protein KIS61_23070 [Candidatus Eremiobacteraeota bacterium]|nr:hypothetical protein [Candidatus Eremiobacteraeota bacterium]
MKPRGLLLTTILMAICNPLGFLFLDPSAGQLEAQLVFAALIVAVSYLVLWFYWKGKNWARILVLITSGIALLNLWDLPSMKWYAQVVVALEAALGACLLVWLNQPQVRAYFARRPSS